MGEDDDELMAELADAGEERSLEERVADLAATVVDLSERLAAREKAAKVKVWDWSNGTEEQHKEWFAELDAWMHKTLFVRWPEYRN